MQINSGRSCPKLSIPKTCGKQERIYSTAGADGGGRSERVSVCRRACAHTLPELIEWGVKMNRSGRNSSDTAPWALASTAPPPLPSAASRDQDAALGARSSKRVVCGLGNMHALRRVAAPAPALSECLRSIPWLQSRSVLVRFLRFLGAALIQTSAQPPPRRACSAKRRLRPPRQ